MHSGYNHPKQLTFLRRNISTNCNAVLELQTRSLLHEKSARHQKFPTLYLGQISFPNFFSLGRKTKLAKDKNACNCPFPRRIYVQRHCLRSIQRQWSFQAPSFALLNLASTLFRNCSRSHSLQVKKPARLPQRGFDKAFLGDVHPSFRLLLSLDLHPDGLPLDRNRAPFSV